MQEKTLDELRAMIDADGIVDTSAYASLSLAIVGAFDALRELDELSLERKRLLWELSFYLMRSNDDGRAGEAVQVTKRVVTESAGFVPRPEPE